MSLKLTMGSLEEAISSGSKALDKLPPVFSVYVLDSYHKNLQEVLPLTGTIGIPARYTSISLENIDNTNVVVFRSSSFSANNISYLSRLVDKPREDSLQLVNNGILDERLRKKFFNTEFSSIARSFLLALAATSFTGASSPLTQLFDATSDFQREKNLLSALLKPWLDSQIKIVDQDEFLGAIEVSERSIKLSADKSSLKWMVTVPEHATKKEDGTLGHPHVAYFNPISLGIGIPVNGPVTLQLYWNNNKVSFRKFQANFSGNARVTIQISNGLTFSVAISDVSYRIVTVPVL